MAGSWTLDSTLSLYPDIKARQQPAIAINDTHIFSIAGICDSGSADDGYSYKYNISSDTWTSIAYPPEDSSAYTYSKAVYYNNKVFLFSSCGSLNGLKLMRYDVASNTWDDITTGVKIKTIIDGATYIRAFLYHAYVRNNIAYLFYTSYYSKKGIVSVNLDTLSITHTSPVDTIDTTAYNAGGTPWDTDTCWLSCLNKVMWIDGFDGMCWIHNLDSGVTTHTGLVVPNAGNGSFRRSSLTWNLGSKGYIYGGNAANNMSIYDWNTGTWSAATSGTGLTNTCRLYRTSCITYKGSVYILGGLDAALGGAGKKTTRKFSYFLDKPTNITAQYSDVDDSITLTWHDNTTEETKYVIERMRDDEFSYTQIGQIPVQVGAEYSYKDDAVDILNHSYQYRVKARMVVV